MSTSRNLTLDVAKGISILLMTVSHLSIFQDNPTVSWFNTNYLFFFRLPLFIFISGLLFVPQDKLLKFVVNKFDGLIKPIITLFILFSSAVVVFGLIKGETLGVSYTKADIIFQNLFFPLWFPITLFIAQFLYNIILYFKKKHLKSTSTFVTIFILLLAVFAHFIDLHSKVLVVNSLIFFLYLLAVGYSIKYMNWIYLIYKPITLIVSTLLLVVLLYLKDDLGIKLDLYHNVFGKFIPTTLTLLCAIVVVLNLSKFIAKIPVLSSFFALCSKASFFILAFHFILGNKVLYPVINKLLGQNLVSNIVQYVLMLSLCILIYKVIFYIPFINKLLLPKKALKNV